MRKVKRSLLALAVGLGIFSLASCDEAAGSSAALSSNSPVATGSQNSEELSEDTGLSNIEYEFEKDYFYSDYNEKSLADTSRQGIKTFETKDDIVFDAVTYEELVNIFESEGDYLILFGGSWCHNTRAAVPYINELANQYNINKIYNFDFYLDGETSQTHIRNTNASDPSRVTPGIEYNYLYGELVSRYLTNLNDYVEYTYDSRSALTYTSYDDSNKTVAKLQVPFLFLYNKDNKVDNSGISNGGTSNEKGTYPIEIGFEEMVDRDADGVYKKVSGTKTYITDEYVGRLKGVFDYIKDNNIKLTDYSDADYIRNLYNKKSGREIFGANDQININTLTYRQLKWLLEQDKDSVIYFGGSWCPNTQATIKTTNDYAVANNVRVYNFDTKLDSGYAKSYWNYSKDLHIRDSANSFVRLYTNLIEQYLTNIVTLYDVNSDASYSYISYQENEQTVKVAKLQVPYLLSYNKSHKDADGFNAPITSYYEEMLVLNEESTAYAYSEANYASLKSHTYNVFNTYLNNSADRDAINIR